MSTDEYMDGTLQCLELKKRKLSFSYNAKSEVRFKQLIRNL
jgi:hypothetical protein